MPDPRTQPASIDVSLSQGVTIAWRDGHSSAYAIKELRDACPCATCTDLHGSGEKRASPLATLPLFKAAGATLTAVQPAGHYGLQFHFSDGHNTGIYTWEYLRSLCPCPACRQPQ